MLETDLIKSWSATQRNVTLSSAEADRVFGCQNLWKMHRSCAACISLGHQRDNQHLRGLMRGSWKFRHVRVGKIWVHELVDEEEVTSQITSWSGQCSNILTKNVPSYRLDRRVSAMVFSLPGGRIESWLALWQLIAVLTKFSKLRAARIAHTFLFEAVIAKEAWKSCACFSCSFD